MTVIEDPDKEWEKLQRIISDLNRAASQSPGDLQIRVHMRMNTRDTSMEAEQKRISEKIKSDMKRKRKVE